MAIFLVFLAGCSSKKYEEAMANGEAAFEEAKYKEAVEYFEEALEYAENRSPANVFLQEIEEIESYMTSLKSTYSFANSLREEKDYISAKDKIKKFDFEDISSEPVVELEDKLEELLKEIEEEEKEFAKSLSKVVDEAKDLGESEKYLAGQELIQDTLDQYVDYMDDQLLTELKDLAEQLDNERKSNAEVPKNMVTEQEELRGTYVKTAGFVRNIYEAEDGSIERILIQSFMDPDSSNRTSHNIEREFTSIEFPKGEYYPDEYDSKGSYEIYLYGYIQGTYAYTTVSNREEEVGNIVLDEIEYIKVLD